MNAWEGFVLGIVQGATEFLPVSSSGHLVIGHTLIGFPSRIAFDAFVHGATMLAIIIYFRSRLIELVHGRSPAYVGKLVVGTLPAIAVGVGLHEMIERAFSSPALVAVTLPITGTALLSLYLVPRSRWLSTGEGRDAAPAPELSWSAAWWIGCAQAVAIFPGISRSGSTIVAGIWLGLAPAAAAEFSFLLGIPAIAGAVVFQAAAMNEQIGAGEGLEYLVGAAAAFVSGLAAIYVVFRLLARREFRWFGFYCWVVGVAFGLWLPAR